MNFWSMAREYLLAAQAVIEKDRQATLGFAPRPTLLLLSHGIELALKAYLLAQGLTVAQVTRIRHDLKGCLSESEASGLRILGRLDRKVIRFINRYYTKKGFEYVVVKGMTLPHCARSR